MNLKGERTELIMIKFFRHIRQRMIKDNRASKYFLYAIGEIILVVIGILIALNINNWNEDRKLRKLEVKYLSNLQSDLDTDMKSNEEMIQYRGEKARASAELLSYPRPTTDSALFAFENTFQSVYFWSRYLPSNNTFKELSSSGQLNTITSDSIKYYLLELNKMYERVESHEHHMRREYEHNFYDLAFHETDIMNFRDFENLPDTGRSLTLFTYRPSDAQIDIMIEETDWLLSNKAFRNGLKLSSTNNLGLREKHATIRRIQLRIDELIDQDLDQ